MVPTPAEPSWHGEESDVFAVNADAESPCQLEPALAVAKEHLHILFLRIGQVIHGDELDRRGREDARAPIQAFAEHHAAER
jgi:hypothetical protein